VLAWAIGILWLVGMTNAFNLLDNMDGLAATLAAIACAFFAIDAYTVDPSRLAALVSLALCLGCVGFLPYNLRLNRPAAVFMGDSGSQVLGFVVGALGLSTAWTVAGSTVATLLLPVLILAVPILDTTLVTSSIRGSPTSARSCCSRSSPAPSD
jgi:UDP-GlcNAc:undecaprenyl-phosphate GlcNAc-1-phosphate transferase